MRANYSRGSKDSGWDSLFGFELLKLNLRVPHPLARPDASGCKGMRVFPCLLPVRGGLTSPIYASLLAASSSRLPCLP
jgi:hypothetical protein